MQKKFSKISTEIIKENPYWIYKKDKYYLPNDEIGDFHYIETNGSILIIPIINNKIVFVNQFRYLNQKNSYEFPGGGIDKRLSIEENLQKELSEEAGYISNKIIYLGEFNPFNGVTNEICYVYIATDLEQKIAKPDITEEFSVSLFDLEQINELLKNNKIWDGMTLSAWTIFLYSKYFIDFFGE